MNVDHLTSNQDLKWRVVSLAITPFYWGLWSVPRANPEWVGQIISRNYGPIEVTFKVVVR